MPRYRENPVITKFSMLCPGISQNTKHLQLTLYKGQVWREKSYLELCNNNVLNVMGELMTLNHNILVNIVESMMVHYLEQNSELYVPPVPGNGFLIGLSQIPWDSEILQSFVWLTDITNITFQYYHKNTYDPYIHKQMGFGTYQLVVGGSQCSGEVGHQEQCAPPTRYIPLYIWTKECFKIKKKKYYI